MVRRSRATAPHRAAVALTCALSVLATACSGADEGATEPTSPASGTAASPQAAVETTARFGAVRGRLGGEQRALVQRQITRTVDGWLDAAYGGDDPRPDVADAFPGFTPGAAARARADRAVMSNAELGPRVDGVELRIRRLALDVLAVEGRAAGVTVRVNVVMDLTGDVERSDRISGRLLLTPTTSGGWRIFGYDMDRGRA